MMVGLILGFGVTLCISFLLLRSKRKIVVRIKPELEDVQETKSGTPTIGGIAFTLALTFVSIMLRLNVCYLVSMWLFAGIGLWDDMEKTHTQNGDGIKSGTKLLSQTLAAILTVVLLRLGNLIPADLPYTLFAVCFFVYMVNAINIADGLDGLATLMALPVLVLVAYLYRDPFLLTFIGCLSGFLVLNLKPAKYFMGDMGSHALGAMIALFGIVNRLEGGVLVATIPFAVEFFSSFVQIIAIRLFRHKVFMIAPLHHDLEKHGVGEVAIVTIFFLSSVCSTGVAAWMLCHGGRI